MVRQRGILQPARGVAVYTEVMPSPCVLILSHGRFPIGRSRRGERGTSRYFLLKMEMTILARGVYLLICFV